MKFYKSNVLILDIKVSRQDNLGFCKQSINKFIFLLIFSYLNSLFFFPTYLKR